MEFHFGHLADYAGPGQHNKLTIVGIFDVAYDHDPSVRPIPLPQAFLVAAIDASVAHGSVHSVEIRFTDIDNEPVGPTIELVDVPFQARGPGRPLRAQLIAQLQGLSVPDVGDYEFQIWVDGERVGDIPLYVVPNPPGA
jgi:hypothetical protein